MRVQAFCLRCCLTKLAHVCSVLCGAHAAPRPLAFSPAPPPQACERRRGGGGRAAQALRGVWLATAGRVGACLLAAADLPYRTRPQPLVSTRQRVRNLEILWAISLLHSHRNERHAMQAIQL